MADQQDVLVVGVGIITSVGLSAGETEGSVRATTLRFNDLPWLDQYFEPFTVAEFHEDGPPALSEAMAEEPALTYREKRLLCLGMLPLLDCLKPISSKVTSVGVFLSLPEIQSTSPIDRGAFLRRFGVQCAGAFQVSKSLCGFQGRAGGLLAVHQASERIRKGQADFIVAGGIDTFRDLYVLGKLDSEGRVKSSRNLDGFIPGEGAGFVLLASRKAAQSSKLPPLAQLSPVASGQEVGHFYSKEPYRGEGLAGTFEKFFQESRLREPVQEVYSSMNGENHWAKEWGFGFLRNRSSFSSDHGFFHPADCFGDTGAASGLILLGLAACGIFHGYRRSPSLVYCSSDYGERATVALTKF